MEIREARPEEYDSIAELTVAAYRVLPAPTSPAGTRADCGM